MMFKSKFFAFVYLLAASGLIAFSLVSSADSMQEGDESPVGVRVAEPVRLEVELGTPQTGESTEDLADALEALEGDDQGAIVAIWDPAEPVNRKVFLLNAGLLSVLAPVGNAYTKAVPYPIRKGISNFGDNLNTPLELLSNLFVLDLKGAGKSTARFVVNSTVGVGGLVDVATKTNWRWLSEPVVQGFDDVLARFRAPCGPYVVIPLIGSFYARQAFAKLLEIPTKVSFWFPITSPVQLAVILPTGSQILSDSAMAGEAIKSFLEPYEAIKMAVYSQGRCKEAEVDLFE